MPPNEKSIASVLTIDSFSEDFNLFENSMRLKLNGFVFAGGYL